MGSMNLAHMKEPIKFRPKSIDILAMQWDGSLESIHEIARWLNDAEKEEIKIDYNYDTDGNVFDAHLPSSSGQLPIFPEDWILRYPDGRLTACEPDAFSDYFEEV